jgi:hypothetical protein
MHGTPPTVPKIMQAEQMKCVADETRLNEDRCSCTHRKPGNKQSTEHLQGTQSAHKIGSQRCWPSGADLAARSMLYATVAPNVAYAKTTSASARQLSVEKSIGILYQFAHNS